MKLYTLPHPLGSTPIGQTHTYSLFLIFGLKTHTYYNRYKTNFVKIIIWTNHISILILRESNQYQFLSISFLTPSYNSFHTIAFFFWWSGYELRTFCILYIFYTNWAKLTRTHDNLFNISQPINTISILNFIVYLITQTREQLQYRSFCQSKKTTILILHFWKLK